MARSDGDLPKDLGPRKSRQVGPPDVGLEAPGPGLLQGVGCVKHRPVRVLLKLVPDALGMALLHIRLGIRGIFGNGIKEILELLDCRMQRCSSGFELETKTP